MHVRDNALTLRALRWALTIVSVAAAAVGIVSGMMFYRNYVRWLPLFENGRYFDPNSTVVYHDNAILYGVLMGLALIVSVATALGVRSFKT